MRRGILVIICVVLLFLLTVGGCRYAGNFLVKEDMPSSGVDAMVMLQGTIADRVLYCADLLKREDPVTDRLIMVEENMTAYSELVKRGVTVKRQTHRVGDMFVQLGVPADRITIIPGGAESTLEEARYIREWLEEHTDINSIVLVSSAYHMRRASKIFEVAFRELDRPVEVYCSPSPYSDANPEIWWRSKEDIQQIILEFMKMGSFHFIERGRLKE